MPALGNSAQREQFVLTSLCAIALIGCALGLGIAPSGRAHPGFGGQVVDLVRIGTTTVLVIVLVLGPGLAWRARRPASRLDLGFLPLPGLGLLVATGALAWVLAGAVSPRAVCAVIIVPLVGWLLIAAVRRGPSELLTHEERWILLVCGCVLGIAIARALWSLGPAGELLGGGSIYRTLEVGDRPDSRIPFAIVQLIAHDASPFGPASLTYFAPYDFSARGPLAGLASAPSVLLAGGQPPIGLEPHPWLPFDPEGFMAYRLAMMTFACTAFLSLWTLIRRLAGPRSARLGLMLAATTPFVVHEVWFTWPKLLAASLVLLAAVSLIDGRALVAGMFAGIAYLVHPLALLSLPALGLMALWPLAGARLRRPQVPAGLWLGGGVGFWLLAWRLINGSHYTQSGFLHYFKEAGRYRDLRNAVLRELGGHPGPVTIAQWLSDRAVSVANTLIPMRLFFFSAHDPSINIATACYPLCAGHSPAVVHFFFQYWNTLPFGLGIVFFPLLLVSLWRAFKRWKWPVFVGVIVPFVLFAVYWGDASTGLLREGLHTWVLTLLAVVAVEQGSRGFPWLRSAPIRALLSLRCAEVLLVAVLPTLVTAHRFYSHQFRYTDTLALLLMIGLCGALALAVWRERPALPEPVGVALADGLRRVGVDS